MKPAAGATVYTPGSGHRTYAPRDKAPVHFEYTTLPMWLYSCSQIHHLIVLVLQDRWRQPMAGTNQEQHPFMS